MTARLIPLDAVDDALLAAWRDLGGNAFHTPDVVLGARGLTGAADVSLLVVAGPTGLDLVLPVHQVDGFRRVPVPALSTWTHDFCYLGDALLRPGREAEAWSAALRLLRLTRPAPWLHLPRLAADGAGFEALLQALHHEGLRAVRVGAHDRAVVRRRPEPTYFDSTVSGVHRKGLRRQRRVLARELGETEVCTVVGRDVEPFLRLEAAGWKAGTAMSAVPGGAELLRSLAAAGRARVVSLRAGPRVLASQVQLLEGTTSSCFKTAYDETLRRHSPGTLLQLDVVQDFHDDASLQLLDSCAAPGHPLVDRLFPDRRPVVTLLVGLAPRGRIAARATPAMASWWSRLTQRPMEVP